MIVRLMLSVLLLLTQGAAWAGVYRWVDENGKVHFTDRPPPGQGEQLELKPAPAPGSSSSSSSSAGVPDRQRLLDMYDKQRAEKKAAKAKEKVRQAKLERQCKRLRHEWRMYNRAGLVYQNNPDGRRYLSADEKDRDMAQMRTMLEEHCGGVPAARSRSSQR